jgi:hypothetical protein
MKNYTDIHQKAIDFLQTFTASDFQETKTYNKFRNYRSMHNKGTLTKGSYETVLAFLGYEKVETWKEPAKPSPYLIDILT